MVIVEEANGMFMLASGVSFFMLFVVVYYCNCKHPSHLSCLRNNRRVFGSKVGAGKGIDWGQAGCGAVPSTCHVWGFGQNTGGYW